MRAPSAHWVCRRCGSQSYGTAALCASCIRWRLLLTQHAVRHATEARASRPLRRGPR
jgi:hypothetical protein